MINRSAIRELLAGIVDRGAPSQANHVLAYLSIVIGFNAAKEADHVMIGLRADMHIAEEHDDVTVKDIALRIKSQGWV